MQLRRMLYRFGFLALLLSQVFVMPSSGQSFGCDQPSPRQETDDSHLSRVVVDAVEFQGENPLSESEQATLTKQIQEHISYVSPGGTDDSWAEEATEVATRGALLDRGYFRALVQGAPFLVRADEQELHYVLRFTIESGPQYRLGNVRFRSVDADRENLSISEGVLRQQPKLGEGEILSVSKVREALENIAKLYHSKGYIDVVTEPQIDTREKDLRIDILFRVDEGQPYRISQMELVGADKATVALQPPQSKGDIFNPDLWSKFLADNQSKLPRGPDVDRYISLSRNVRGGTVQITLDLRPCPTAPLATISPTEDELETPIPARPTLPSKPEP